MIDEEKSQRARLSLEGLSIGDSFGQRFFFPWVVEKADRHNLPQSPWYYTDDTEMAMALIQCLENHGEIVQDNLALKFAERFQADPGRGYGAGAIELLPQISQGVHWKVCSQGLFGGSGSFGNGGAMRAAPLGAWYADDISSLIEQAKLSAEVTHAHYEGQIGAIAVSLAAGWASRRNKQEDKEPRQNLIPHVLEHLEDCDTKRGIEKTLEFKLDDWAFDVANAVGCGEQVSSQDTVPLCLWLAAAHLDDYCEAMWVTARVGGDIDTNCAIVGGIVAMNVGDVGIPDEWRSSREPLAW